VSPVKRRRNIDIGRFVSMIVLVLLAAAVLFGGFRLWKMLRDPETRQASSGNETNAPAKTTTNPTGSAISDDEDDFVPDTTEPTTGTAIEPDQGSSTPSVDTSTDLVGPDGTTYIVRSGDMLMKIAIKFYGDESKYKLIMDANGITDPNKIAVGQKLVIPPKN